MPSAMPSKRRAYLLALLLVPLVLGSCLSGGDLGQGRAVDGETRTAKVEYAPDDIIYRIPGFMPRDRNAPVGPQNPLVRREISIGPQAFGALPVMLQMALRRGAPIVYLGLSSLNTSNAVYAFADESAGTWRETTGPIPLEVQSDIYRNEASRLAAQEQLLAGIEAVMHVLEDAGEVADVILIVIGVGQLTFALKRVAGSAAKAALRELAETGGRNAVLVIDGSGAAALRTTSGTLIGELNVTLTLAEREALLAGERTVATGLGATVVQMSARGASENAAAIARNTGERVFNVTKGESSVWRGLGRGKMGRKTSGSGRRTRHYEWDHTHNDIEVYDANGIHLGSMDPVSGQMYKPPVSGRRIKLF